VATTAGVRAERLRRLSILQRTFDALPVDGAVAASYGQLAAAMVDAGRRPRARTMDLFIAATAHAHSARVYTRNEDDFVGVDGLVEVVSV
jgi:predicted nucleic acid-binding protein